MRDQCLGLQLERRRRHPAPAPVPRQVAQRVRAASGLTRRDWLERGRQ